jgi:hypothetical protein
LTPRPTFTPTPTPTATSTTESRRIFLPILLRDHQGLSLGAIQSPTLGVSERSHVYHTEAGR